MFKYGFNYKVKVKIKVKYDKYRKKCYAHINILLA